MRREIRVAHERMLSRLTVHTHLQKPPPERRRGPGFMEDARAWAKVAAKKSPMRKRKT